MFEHVALCRNILQKCYQDSSPAARRVGAPSLSLRLCLRELEHETGRGPIADARRPVRALQRA